MQKLSIIFSLLLAAVVWQMMADFLIRDPFLFPSFSSVVLSIYSLKFEIPVDASISLLHFSLGLAAAVCVGIPLGAVMGWFKRVERWVDPVVEVLRPVPPLAWVPFAIIWFGLTHQSAGFIVFIGAVFPILINTYSGFRNVPKILVDAAKVLGCREGRLIKSIAFPSASPQIAAGIRIGMGIGWMCLVAAEIFGRTSGLGYKLWHFYQLHQMDNVVSYMIILGLIGLLLDRTFRWITEEKFFRWRKGFVA
jgi:NitT/TauT family transport system permease protein